MLEIGIMLEGQNGLNWERWKRITHFVEDAGFIGLFRSDHFTNQQGPVLDALELWTSLTWLADNTKRIEFGPLVAPFSFRHPVHIAHKASAIDDLSGGRLTLGLGAGWQDREHTTFGFDLLSVKSRLDRFEEGVEVVSQLLRSDDLVTFEGEYYQVREGTLLPRPQRKDGPRILVGGKGEKRTLPLVARFADEWNCVMLTPEAFSKKNEVLENLITSAGRKPESVRRSMMTPCIFGKDEASLNEKVSAYETTIEDLQEHGIVTGNANAVNEQLKKLEEAGVQRIMLQWLDLDDMDGLEALAKAVL